jgi:hypothetical protein
LKILLKSSTVNNCILLVKKEHTACYYYFLSCLFLYFLFLYIAKILRSYIVLWICYWSVVRLLCVLCPSVVGKFCFRVITFNSGWPNLLNIYCNDHWHRMKVGGDSRYCSHQTKGPWVQQWIFRFIFFISHPILMKIVAR